MLYVFMLKSWLAERLSREHGQTTTEYAVVLVLAAALAVGLFTGALQGAIANAVGKVAGAIDSVTI